MQKSGLHGVFNHRGALGSRFAKSSKAALASLADRELACDALRLEATAPGERAGRGKWLFDCSGRGRREVLLANFAKAKRAADRARVPFKTNNYDDWRHFMDAPIDVLSKEDLDQVIVDLGHHRHLTVSDGSIILGSQA